MAQRWFNDAVASFLPFPLLLGFSGGHLAVPSRPPPAPFLPYPLRYPSFERPSVFMDFGPYRHVPRSRFFGIVVVVQGVES